MYCEKYHCEMSEAACIARQNKAKSSAGWGLHGTAQDPGCRNCDQGQAIRKKSEMEEQSKANAPQEPVGEKVCKKCKDPKPLTAFAKHPGLKDGHENTCKECRNKMARERLWKKKLAQKNKTRTPSKTPPLKSSPKKTAAVACPGNGSPTPTLILDLSKYPDILAMLQQAAEKEIRSLEHQALYFLREMAKASNSPASSSANNNGGRSSPPPASK